MTARRLVRIALALALAASAPAGAGDLRIIAPAAPGSSWDQLAQVLKGALEEADGIPRVDIANVPGNGGTVGLLQFLQEDADAALLVTGLTMLDATFVHRAPVTLDQLTPIARLSSEPFALAVPAASPFRSLDELRLAAREDPGRITWAGGPGGGIDHVAAVLLWEAFAADPARLVYVPFLTSQEAAIAAAEGRVGIVALSSGELAAEAKSGRVRVLGVAAPGRIASIDAPTLAEAGLPFDLSNWRGLLARPGMAPETRDRLAARVVAVAASPAWRDLLEKKGWQDAYLGPDAFGEFLRTEQQRVRAAIKAVSAQKR